MGKDISKAISKAVAEGKKEDPSHDKMRKVLVNRMSKYIGKGK